MELTQCVIEIVKPDAEVLVDYRYAGGRYSGEEDVVAVQLGPIRLVGPPEQTTELLMTAIDNIFRATAEGRAAGRGIPRRPKELPWFDGAA